MELVEKDVIFSDLRDPSTVLGGLNLSRGITNANFYAMLRCLVTNSGDVMVQTSNGDLVMRDNNPLVAGHYLLVAEEPICLSEKPAYVRTLTRSMNSRRLSSFSNAVRARDNRCIITKTRVPPGTSNERYNTFEAAHIVPLARVNDWHAQSFSALITAPPPAPYERETINSVQNGLLMRCTMHQYFNSHGFSILVEDNYKVIFFRGDSFDLDNISGTYLDDEFINNPQRPPDALFQWHFEQTVLRNMRGAGESVPEYDFPPGSDMVGTILSGPNPAERMEAEIFTRLAGAAGILDDMTNTKGDAKADPGDDDGQVGKTVGRADNGTGDFDSIA